MNTRTRIALSEPHPHIGPLLSSYQDGLTTPDETATVEQHLGACERCRDFLTGLRQAREAISGLPAQQPDADRIESELAAVLRRTVYASSRHISDGGPKWRLPRTRRWLLPELDTEKNQEDITHERER